MKDAQYYKQYRAKRKANHLSLTQRVERLEAIVLGNPVVKEVVTAAKPITKLITIPNPKHPCHACHATPTYDYTIGGVSYWLCAAHAPKDG